MAQLFKTLAQKLQKNGVRDPRNIGANYKKKDVKEYLFRNESAKKLIEKLVREFKEFKEWREIEREKPVKIRGKIRKVVRNLKKKTEIHSKISKKF